MDKLRPIFSAIQFELGNFYWAYVYRPKHLAYHRSIHQIDSALVRKVFLSLSEYLLEKFQPIPYQQLFGHFHRPVSKGMIVKGIEIRHPSRCGDLCDKEFWTTFVPIRDFAFFFGE